MKFFDLKNSFSNNVSAIYLCEGNDAYFRERALFLIKERFVKEASLNFALFDGENYSLEELASALSSYPFMSEKRVTAIREFYPKQTDLTKSGLDEYFKNPYADSIFVILNSKPSESLKKYSSVEFVDCNKGDANILNRWVTAECKLNKVEIDYTAASMLCEYCLLDMTRIENETKKVIAFAGEGGTVTKAEVDALVSKDSEYRIYEMTDYIGKKNFDLAFSVIKELVSKGETEQRLLTSIYNYFEKLLNVSISGKTDLELSKLYNIKEYAIKKTREQAKYFKARALKNAVDILCDMDYKSKSGQIDFNEAFYLALFKIMTEK